MSDHMLTTKSVTSAVMPEGSDADHADVHEGRVQPVGHITLLDWDDCPTDYATVRASDLPGVTVILESSPGSCHAWNLSVADLKTTGCRMILNDADPAQIKNGLKRGYWRLRHSPKEWQNGEVYKDAPKLVTVSINETEKPQSRAHFGLVQELFDVPDLPSSFNWEGGEYTEESYKTLTDEGKRIRRGDDGT